MGRPQSDTYSSLFNKSDNVNLDEAFDRKSMFVHVLRDTCCICSSRVIVVCMRCCRASISEECCFKMDC